MNVPAEHRDAVADCTISAKLVYHALREDGAQSVHEIEAATLLPERTARRAARQLCDAGLAVSERDPRDPRRKWYRLRNPPG